MKAAVLSAPEPLGPHHTVADFDCAEASLNSWLKLRAAQNQLSSASRAYVVCEGARVVGYYCLSAGAIARGDAPSGLKRNRPDPIPVLVMGRLAVDLALHQNGLGTALLRDAIERTMKAATIAGVTALLVNALSEQAKRFYLSRGFIESPVRPMTLCLMLASVERARLKGAL